MIKPHSLHLAPSPIPGYHSELAYEIQPEEAKSILRVAAYHRQDFDRAVISFPFNVRINSPTLTLPDSTTTTANLGHLEVLPLELLHKICLELDIASVCRFRQTNTRARQTWMLSMNTVSSSNMPSPRSVHCYEQVWPRKSACRTSIACSARRNVHSATARTVTWFTYPSGSAAAQHALNRTKCLFVWWLSAPPNEFSNYRNGRLRSSPASRHFLVRTPPSVGIAGDATPLSLSLLSYQLIAQSTLDAKSREPQSSSSTPIRF